MEERRGWVSHSTDESQRVASAQRPAIGMRWTRERGFMPLVLPSSQFAHSSSIRSAAILVVRMLAECKSAWLSVRLRYR